MIRPNSSPHDVLRSGTDNNDHHYLSAGFVYLMFSACFNGISMAALDVAKRQVTAVAHGTNGFRVCDYPAVQVSLSSPVHRFLPLWSALDLVNHNLYSVNS